AEVERRVTSLVRRGLRRRDGHFGPTGHCPGGRPLRAEYAPATASAGAGEGGRCRLPPPGARQVDRGIFRQPLCFAPPPGVQNLPQISAPHVRPTPWGPRVRLVFKG